MVKVWLSLFALVAVLGIVAPADAAEERISLGEVSVSQPAPGVDQATLEIAAKNEIRSVDAKRMKRRVVVSVAATASDAPVGCTVNTVVRDRKSGNVIAVIEGRATSEGRGDATLRKALLTAAVRTAVRQIPDAIN